MANKQKLRCKCNFLLANTNNGVKGMINIGLYLKELHLEVTFQHEIPFILVEDGTPFLKRSQVLLVYKE